jgi:hypothetical protein
MLSSGIQFREEACVRRGRWNEEEDDDEDNDGKKLEVLLILRCRRVGREESEETAGMDINRETHSNTTWSQDVRSGLLVTAPIDLILNF